MSTEFKKWSLLLLLAGIWGGSFILMKRGMYTLDGDAIFNSNQVGALRMLIASLVLLPFGIQAFKKIKRKKDFLLLAIVGFCGNFFPAFLFTFAETKISSGYAGMLNSCTPIFTLLISVVVFKYPLTLFQIVGILVGTVGLGGLLLSGQSANTDLSLTHVFAIVLATFLYGISLNTIKNTLGHINAVDISSIAFLILLVPSIGSFFYFDTLNTIQTNPFAKEGLLFISILSVFGTAIALIIFNRIIALSNTLFASSVTYFIPMVAVFIGLYFKESIHYHQVIAMLVVLLGVFIANYLSSILKKRT